ncbi:flagellar basal-body rod protein FlgB [Cribrihabitans marinus]|uniref:Flagellar basal-body rod protein FlgB n=1 Tax=Cribrihabitans marinus TaxID=1227549 RepID=A0A1H7DI57_9RHOB|nr:FlgB family protein [Cribrihabitans marinus]GGH39534.1 flagellar biosynthesis protein FlgB [Cribrihabitans marinus]SEK01483.1 flagellar basal-body rod protein FlgB [Cribrihabitans marinus]
MFQDLTVFKTAHAMATHAGTRQAVIARNMANADTPGYRARDIPSFAETLAQSGGQMPMRTTRAGHGRAAPGAHPAEFTRDAPADPNGNSVSVEEEVLMAVEVKRQHDRAIAIYKSSLTLLRSSLGRT